MTYRLPIMQPLWSFASTACQPAAADQPRCDHAQLPAAVQGWTTGEDGRPHVVFAVQRKS